MTVISTQRVREFRERQRSGKIQLVAEISEADVIDRLIEARLLHPRKSDDDDAVRRAWQRWCEISLEQ